MALTDQIILNSLSSVRNIEDEFTSLLTSVMGTLERQLIGQINTSSTTAIAETALARQNIERILLDSGYYEATGKLLSDGYQRVIEESFKVYQDSIGENFQFADVSLQRLNSLKQMDLTQFGRLGDDFATDMTRVLLDLQFGTVSNSQALSILRSNVERFNQHAQTWVTTGLSGIYRESSVLLANDNKIEKFIYVGPRDSITRPFCAEHLNEIKTKKEWDELDNGQILPISTFGGGYNCRHQLVGVS